MSTLRRCVAVFFIGTNLLWFAPFGALGSSAVLILVPASRVALDIHDYEPCVLLLHYTGILYIPAVNCKGVVISYLSLT